MARRYLIKMGRKRFYAVRGRDGRFKDIQRLSRASKADRRKITRRKVKGKGQGFRGDYKRKRR